MTAPLKCPAMASWQALFAGTMPPMESASYERHLELCPACQQRLDRDELVEETLRQMVRRVGDVTAPAIDPTLCDFLERLHKGQSERATLTSPPDLYFLRPTDAPGLLGMLGDYAVQEVIGEGGMGIVLKAYEPALHRLVAIKVLAAAVAGSATARRRFTREAQAAAAVCHDHIVAVHGVHEVDGLPYLVMQYIAGESLQERLDRTGPLELTAIVRIGMQTAQGLAAAHAQGLIHRDIKPANLLLENGLARVKITDFGLARMVDELPLTQNGVVAGTPEYMAPEQARGETIDHRADLFSLGSVLYAMCTGVPPFRGSTAVAVLRQVSDQNPRPIRALNPETPAWLESVIMRLLAKGPPERFQTAAEVAELLEKYLAHLSQPTTIVAPDLPLLATNDTLDPLASEPGMPAAKGFRRLWLLVPLVMLAALGLWLALLFQAAPLPDQAPTRELYHDFRGGGPLPSGFQLHGQEGALISREEDGLRITVPITRKSSNVAGVVLPVNIQGNFEITASYQLLKADKPEKGHGVGFELYVIPNTARKGTLSLSRLNRVDEGDVYWTTRMTTNEDNKEHYEQHIAQTSARSGQLCLIRTGEEVTCWAAEGVSGEFKKLFKQHLGLENVKAIRLVATPGWVPNAVDLLIKDLRVRPLNAEEAQVALAEPTEVTQVGPKHWLAIMLALSLLGTLFLMIWLAMWQSRRARQLSSPAPGEDAASEAAPAAALLGFACASCGKNLKAKRTMAGKACKCPQCGQRVRVPAAQGG